MPFKSGTAFPDPSQTQGWRLMPGLIRLKVSNGRIINKKEAGPIQRFLYTAGSIVSNGVFSATCTPHRLLDDMRLYFDIHPDLIADHG